MKIRPYKQKTMYGCLAACIIMLLESHKKIDFEDNAERDIMRFALDSAHTYYVSGVVSEILTRFTETKIQILADNKYFTKELKTKASKKIAVKHHKITLNLIENLLSKYPIICYINNRHIGVSLNVPHFIVLEKIYNERFVYIDPMKGTRGFLSKEKLEDGISSLKKHIKICPLIITIK